MNMSNTVEEHKGVCSLCRRSFRCHSCGSNKSSAVVHSVHRTAVRVKSATDCHLERVSRITTVADR